MTRLLADDIKAIPATIKSYDRELLEKTGCSLQQIASAAAAAGTANIMPADYRVAVIPITSGLGTIAGFSEAVCSVACHLGFQAYVTAGADVSGLSEAYRGRADLAMLADDRVFVAINLKTGSVADNAEATALGYAAALKLMAGSLNDRDVLLIGAGQVGSRAAEALAEMGARLVIFDINKEAEASLVRKIREKTAIEVCGSVSLDDALKKCRVIFDASPGTSIIAGNLVNERTIVAAPGVPLGLSCDAEQVVKERLIHDPLQIGVAAMLYMVLAPGNKQD